MMAAAPPPASSSAPAGRIVSWDEVQKHSSKNDVWMVIDGKVYDSTKFLDEHPGGEEVLLEQAGLDASEAFEEIGHSEDARELLTSMLVGTLSTDSSVCISVALDFTLVDCPSLRVTSLSGRDKSRHCLPLPGPFDFGIGNQCSIALNPKLINLNRNLLLPSKSRQLGK